MAVIRSLPLFPLSVVLYPNERLPLHIFEKRYKEMISDCLQEGTPFGLIFSEEEEMAEVGCTARVDQVLERYADGRLDILTEGEERFRLLELHQERAYLMADVEPVEEPEDPAPSHLQERVITQHMKLLELVGHTVRPSFYENVNGLSYVLAHNAGLSTQQKQEVLELLTESERIAYLADHFQMLLPRVEEQENVRRRIRSNGHFKDFPPEED